MWRDQRRQWRAQRRAAYGFGATAPPPPPYGWQGAPYHHPASGFGPVAALLHALLLIAFIVAIVGAVAGRPLMGWDWTLAVPHWVGIVAVCVIYGTLAKQLRMAMEELSIDPEFAQRNLNEGFSGGEKKRHEILQLELLNPKIAILDETDSGLDIDALKVVSAGINRFREDPAHALLLITHYPRLLRYVEPDFVHVFVAGRIAEEGGMELAEELETNGYERFLGIDATRAGASA